MRDLLRHRDFRLLLAGQTLSMCGDSMMLLVLAMWARELTGSNGAAGLVIGAVVLPSLFAPASGLVIDRFRRRRLMIVVDLTTATVVLALVGVRGAGGLWLLYVVAFAYGASLIAFQSARSALLHTMLPDALLGQANGGLGTVREALRLVGPLAGAGLYAAFGGHVVAAVDVATFLVSAGTLAVMRVDEPRPEPTGEPALRRLTAGVRHLARTRVLRVASGVTVLAVLALGACESVGFAVVTVGLHRPVEFVGVLRAAAGAGAVVVGILTTVLIRRTGELAPITAGLVLMAVGAALWTSPSALVVAAGEFLFGGGLPALIVGITTAIQRRTPGAMQGRAFTAFELVVGVPQLLSIVVGAALVDLVDYRLLVAVVVAGLALAAVYAGVGLRGGTAEAADPGRAQPDDEAVTRETADPAHPAQAAYPAEA